VKINFDFNDFVPQRSVFGLAARHLSVENRQTLLKLFAVVTLPLVVLGCATWYEERFHFGSVTRSMDGYGDLLGMSFLGDTMVWPFVFFVPACLLLTMRAINQAVILLNTLCEKIQKDYGDGALPEDFVTGLPPLTGSTC
tara:strand:- start:12 stop:431 length:420 start_codon:yes stop_codon:yes gene_type:complete